MRVKATARSLLFPLAGALGLLQLACTGDLLGSDSGEPAQVTPGPPTSGLPDAVPSGAAPVCTTPAVGPSPLRRLTAAEYNNAVADLLGDASGPAKTFPTDNRVGPFDNTAATQTVPVLLAEKYVESAALLAEGVKDVTALVGCDASAANGAACVSGFIERFGRRAYRRPLAPEEVAGLLQIWSSTTAQSDAVTGVRGVLTAFLISPHFLFRPEFGAGPSNVPDARQVSQFEVASRMASLLWASLPDDTLLDAAAEGQLGTRQEAAIQAKRMLAAPRAQAAIGRFYEQWLGLELLTTATKSAELFPEFQDPLRAAMGEETKRFIQYVLWESDARASTLLSAPYSFLNARLASFYGVTGPANDTTFARVELDPAQRAGVLTQAGLLTMLASPTASSPFKRGAWIRRRLLCQELPDPPNDVPELPEPEPGTSGRQRAALHSSSPACIGCHSLIDGLGFGLEQYDALGRFRSMDQGVAVDSSGNVTSTEDSDGPFNGGAELAARLAQSPQVERCVATQWLRYSLARRETDDDACSLQMLQQGFATSGGDLKELMVQLTQTDAFWAYRAPVEAP